MGWSPAAPTLPRARPRSAAVELCWPAVDSSSFAARASGFDAWLERERQRLQILAADAMQRLCELQRARGDAAASMATAMRTPLVGRRYELAQLSAALQLCLDSGRGRTFLIRGEAGIRKTRLVRALSEIALRQGFCVHARPIVELTSRGMRYLVESFALSLAGCAVGRQEVAERSRASGSLRAEAIARLKAAWALLALGD